ncbi:bifunctional cobalt-precorrin-7 (C(5))-methyltransferase/cobalt-precorrin-6B (C(15))-methyltransferase [Desulfohalovibrio reitneri]|uniref:bifunctional cobalt-precorrin-7 (C(5))-methyltransferase/cobalt-precorrin-6B (C(15))-methyltransferase n=1 Tax=Desulfohalovibrio reitneri TaxID=1307759 RepID=UPI0004A77618|nr:bifunctional cobalt-precorrin-7 (C(5))-methyltransferase/cobalt-precorrin-6B (C(15))-methyltransferase [Desulfohalovibrio reitneri]
MNKIDVVGLGLNPGKAPEGVRELAARAEVLAGGKRQLDAFPDLECERVVLSSPLEETIDTLRGRAEEGKRVLVLADGDPLFYGIGRRLAEALGRNSLRIHPGVTTLQTAAARLGLPWHDIRMVSLHGRSDYAPLFAALTGKDWVAVFTDEENTPAAIARAMMERGAEDFSMWVFEDLDSESERVGTYHLRHVAMERFSSLNLVVLERIRSPRVQLRLGIPDEDFAHEAGLITKWQVRAVGLAALAIQPSSTVWDLGAGSGSVAIEAAFLAREGRVEAVEREPERFEQLKENVRRTGAWLVRPVRGEAPACLDELPDPDRIFIGGGLGEGDDLLRAACQRLLPGGRLTAHAILLDSLSRIKAHLAELGWPHAIQQVQCSVSEPLGADERLKSGNPVFIVSARKPE